MDDVISTIQAATQVQEDKIAALERYGRDIEEFMGYAVETDRAIADVVRQRKDDFYASYSHLRSDSNISGWEKFCDNWIKPIGEWCRDNWIASVLVAAIIFPVALAAFALLGVLSLLTGCSTQEIRDYDDEATPEPTPTPRPPPENHWSPSVEPPQFIIGTSVFRVSRDNVTSSNEPLETYGEAMTINATYVYQTLTDADWSHNAICAILGNMQDESTINPGRYERRDGGTGYGLVQWSEYKGVHYYYDWADSEGLQRDDIRTQLLRILTEVENPRIPPEQWVRRNGYPDFNMSFYEFTQSTEPIPHLVEVFLWNYERPPANETHIDLRLEHAEHWDQYLGESESHDVQI